MDPKMDPHGDTHLTQTRCLTSLTSANGTINTHEAPPSSNEMANTRAATHPNTELHLRVHADQPRPCKRFKTPCVLAKSLRNCAVSEEKQPPTSPARQTVPPPHLARGLLVPLGVLMCPWSEAPSQRMGLTSVVSTARLLSRTPPTPRYSSARRWSAPFHLLLGRCGPQQSPEENPFVQRSQQLSKPSDGGPSCRGDGTHECAVKESGRRNLRSSRMRTTREGQLVISSKWRPCSKVWGANHPRFTTLNSSSHTFKIPSSIAVLEIQSNAERMFEIGQHLTSRGCTAN